MFELEENWVKARGYQFTTGWFSDAHAESWKKLFEPYRGQFGIRYLEIGVWEGRSLLWMMDHILTHSESSAVAIDFFHPPAGNLFQTNLAKSGHVSRVQVLQGLSELLLPNLPAHSFDIIYVDGDHAAKGVVIDAVLAWLLLKSDGLLVFDDYHWGEETYPSRLVPRTAIDFFLHAFADEIQIVHEGFQVAVKKRIVPKKTSMVTHVGPYTYYWLERSLEKSETALALNDEQKRAIESLLRQNETRQVAELEALF